MNDTREKIKAILDRECYENWHAKRVPWGGGMRVMGFSVMWEKLSNPEFTTFRLPRKDTDWHIGERVQGVYHPRSKTRKFLFLANVINVWPCSFDGLFAHVITEEEAIEDGFTDLKAMQDWLKKAHNSLDSSQIFNKITLRRILTKPEVE